MNDTKIYTPGISRATKSELWAAYAKMGRLIARLGAVEEESKPQVFIYGAPDHDPIMVIPKKVLSRKSIESYCKSTVSALLFRDNISLLLSFIFLTSFALIRKFGIIMAY